MEAIKLVSDVITEIEIGPKITIKIEIKITI
jgi:hypothetical protein